MKIGRETHRTDTPLLRSHLGMASAPTTEGHSALDWQVRFGREVLCGLVGYSGVTRGLRLVHRVWGLVGG